MAQALGHLVFLIFWLLAAAPLVCAAWLAAHFAAGRALKPGAAWLIYGGCLLWIPWIASRAAIDEAWRSWLWAPIAAGALLGVLWDWRAPYPSTFASPTSRLVVFLTGGLMGCVTLGGGYFDRVFQAPHAQKTVLRRGVRMDDPAALGALLSDPDPYARWGAAMFLAHLGPAAAPALEPLADALLDEDYRVTRTAERTLRALGPAAKGPALQRLAQRHRSTTDPKIQLAIVHAASGIGASPPEWQSAIRPESAQPPSPNR